MGAEEGERWDKGCIEGREVRVGRVIRTKWDVVLRINTPVIVVLLIVSFSLDWIWAAYLLLLFGFINIGLLIAIAREEKRGGRRE